MPCRNGSDINLESLKRRKADVGIIKWSRGKGGASSKKSEKMARSEAE